MPKIKREQHPVFEFHINGDVRRKCALAVPLFQTSGNVVVADFKAVRSLAKKLNEELDLNNTPYGAARAGQLNAMGLIDEILHYMLFMYKKTVQNDVFELILKQMEGELGERETEKLLETFCTIFPPRDVYAGASTVKQYLAGFEAGVSRRSIALEELLMLGMANMNPAFMRFGYLFDDAELELGTVYTKALTLLRKALAEFPPFGPDGQNLWDLLRAPALASPDSLEGQLRWIRERWGTVLGDFLARLLTTLDVISEENKPHWEGSPGPTQVLDFGYLQNEYERFSADQDWMPRTVLMAKCTLVWLFQLSRKYGYEITRLDQIPDAELDQLAARGFTGLWLIGLWERSKASRTIKQWKGNPEAAASAYSLYDYDIAGELGGWGALNNLKERCARRGIRLGSDMVPNHTGIDSRWISEHPDRFLQLDSPPYPQYQYNSGNLSSDPNLVIQIEDHYYDNSDCAVVFHYYNRSENRHRYIYHGNDGTSMPWNDTAQIDFLNAEAREAVIRTIVGVCRQFPIVRFDAAMTLAKRHIQRLWYPEPGHGGDIASRAEHAISTAEFNRRIPNEFWREVVDRCAAEAPHTLLLAEAFWMMEGYFVRTLGMHRVYNSAFMNMLKKEENAKYRATIKNTLAFDGEILKRFVNFMNNPDEETAVAQFGKGDKYFGICTLMVTMPGLPMFGHGQIEGFEEKYGMEYRRAYRDETPDSYLVERHEKEIFPLMKMRSIFSGSENFNLYDFWRNDTVDENVFAYSNRAGEERALVLYNNFWQQTSGWIKAGAVDIPQKDGSKRRDSLAQALLLHSEADAFALLRCKKTGKWFIRSSKALFEEGLFIILQGYEVQVYTDIYEVRDPSLKTWARLNEISKGGALKNPQEALQDMLLDEVYAPYWALFSVERVKEVQGLLLSRSDVSGDAVKKCVLDFFNASFRFVKDGEYEHEPYKIKTELTPSTADAAVDVFCSAIKAFAQSFAALDGVKSTWAKDVGDYLEGGYELPSFIYAYCVMEAFGLVIGKSARGFDAAGFAAHLGLDRKFREEVEQNGVDGGKAYRVIEIAKAVLSRINVVDASHHTASFVKSGGAIKPDQIVIENCNDDDFKRILGVNSWEGVEWFNKESFEEALFFAPIFALQYAPPDEVSAFVDVFKKAEEASGYKLDVLIGHLIGKKKAGTKEPKAASKEVKEPKAPKEVKPKKEAKPKEPKPAKAEKPKKAAPKKKA